MKSLSTSLAWQKCVVEVIAHKILSLVITIVAIAYAMKALSYVLGSKSRFEVIPV
jgi:hypothetical protein